MKHGSEGKGKGERDRDATGRGEREGREGWSGYWERGERVGEALHNIF